MSNPQSILCISRTHLFAALGAPALEGFMPIASRSRFMQKLEGHSFYAPRTESLEADESIKQIIPQIALLCGDKVCIHKIPETAGDKRLVDQTPIFFGGHLEHGDADIEDGADRELGEEVKHPAIISKHFLGVLNVDCVDHISRCHVGLMFVYRVATMDATPNEDDGVCSKSLEWVPVNDLSRPGRSNRILTPWSVAALPAMRKFIASIHSEL